MMEEQERTRRSTLRVAGDGEDLREREQVDGR